jgi:hypothetical protein
MLTLRAYDVLKGCILDAGESEQRAVAVADQFIDAVDRMVFLDDTGQHNGLRLPGIYFFLLFSTNI